MLICYIQDIKNLVVDKQYQQVHSKKEQVKSGVIAGEGRQALRRREKSPWDLGISPFFLLSFFPSKIDRRPTRFKVLMSTKEKK